jgi:energy-coupling factor transporter ATP-binding protein EcfA2
MLELTDLGFAPDRLARMHDLITRPEGIILVTGPTGSGKTTTLYACLNKINSPDLNILTAEDPIEYDITGLSQMQVNPKIGLTFASCLRAFLRQDPDVIMVGEIRDKETAEIAVHASLTGHLVLSTIHTNDAAGAVTRLVEMGIENFHLTSSLLAILAQRLVRVLCKSCKEPYTPREVDLARSVDGRAIGAAPAPGDPLRQQRLRRLARGEGGAARIVAGLPITLYRAKGCPECQNTGLPGPHGHLRAAAHLRRGALPRAEERRLAHASAAPRWRRAWTPCATTACARCSRGTRPSRRCSRPPRTTCRRGRWDTSRTRDRRARAHGAGHRRRRRREGRAAAPAQAGGLPRHGHAPRRGRGDAKARAVASGAREAAGRGLAVSAPGLLKILQR